MNARPNVQGIDALGQHLADQGFRTLMSLSPEIKTASPARQEAVCAAIRAKVLPAVDSLLKDTQLAPCLAEAAFHNAVLTLALAGVKAWQATAKRTKYSNSKTRKITMPSMSNTIERTPVTTQLATTVVT
ncbi:MAG: hypothetical protein RLZZ153_1798 [Pseudomonadota bacterium]|jgi:cytochrome c oxidase assembly factor CtaG